MISRKSYTATRACVTGSTFLRYPLITCSLGAPNDPHGGVVEYFKDEMKGEQVYEVIALKPKSYLVCSVKATMCNPDGEMPPPVYMHKAVVKGISRANIKHLTQENYRQMYNEVANCRNVINRRIGTKLHQVTQYII